MSKDEMKYMPLIPSGYIPDLQVKTQKSDPARKGPEVIELVVQPQNESGFWPFATGLLLGTVAAFIGTCLSFAALA